MGFGPLVSLFTFCVLAHSLPFEYFTGDKFTSPHTQKSIPQLLMMGSRQTNIEFDFLERNLCNRTGHKFKADVGKIARSKIEILEGEQLRTMTPDDFVQKFVRSRTPVILKSASSLLLHNASSWSWEALRNSTLAHLTTTVSKGSRGVKSKQQMLLRGFMNLIASGDRSWTSSFPTSAVKTWTGGRTPDRPVVLPLGKAAFQNVKVLGSRLFDNRTISGFGRFTFFIHNDGGNLPHHHESTFNALTVGAKRWSMFDGQNIEKMSYEEYPFGTAQKSWHWFKDHEPQLEVQHWDFVQERGDVVFVPDGMTHVTMDLCVPTVGMALGLHYKADRHHHYKVDRH